MHERITHYIDGASEVYIVHESLMVAISDLQISPIFAGSIIPGKNNVQSPGGSTPRALSNGVCYAIIGQTVEKPRPPKLSPYKLNTNNNGASGNSAPLICTVKASLVPRLLGGGEKSLG